MARDALLDFNMPAVTSGTTYTHASDQASTDVIDLEAASNMLGEGNPVYLKVICTTAVTQTGTAVFSLQESSDNASSDAYVNTSVVSATYTNGAGLTAGATILDVPLPKDLERYLRMFASLVTGNVTAGGFEAYLYVR